MNANDRLRKGTYLALLTAIVSGVSIFINSYGVRRVPDPFVFTTAKNVIVAAGLVAAIVMATRWSEVRVLDRSGWLKLVTLGAVGGGVPFLMFFYGLSKADAPTAAFMHKTLFIWVALLAVPLLGERVGRLQAFALALLVIGHLALGNRPARWAWGEAEIFTLGATLIWAVEAVFARRFLDGGISAPVGAAGRMGFGALVMLGYIAVTGRIDTMASMDASQWGWVLLTAAFLGAYVISYYSALKAAPAVVVSSVLVIGSIITATLHATVNSRSYTPEQFAGFVVIALAIGITVLATLRGKQLAREVSVA